MNSFQTIGIMGREDDSVTEPLQILIKFLLSQQCRIMLDQPIASLLVSDDIPVCSPQAIADTCDLVIVVGGDGSLLGAARLLACHDVPVLGINRGRLGFLTDIMPDAIAEQVGAVLQGHYSKEKRFLLTAFIQRPATDKTEFIGSADALNDVVVNSGTSARMIEFDLYIDDEFVYHQRSDGLIIATPTGSTAYSLSGGGPIMHPQLDAIVLVPMFPHSLSSRPLVVEGNSGIKLVITDNNIIRPPVTCDGQVNLTALPGDTICIQKKSHQLKLIHPLEHSFYASCREKLGWSAKLGR